MADQRLQAGISSLDTGSEQENDMRHPALRILALRKIANALIENRILPASRPTFIDPHSVPRLSPTTLTTR
jgi:hypothetical protein